MNRRDDCTSDAEHRRLSISRNEDIGSASSRWSRAAAQSRTRELSTYLSHSKDSVSHVAANSAPDSQTKQADSPSTIPDRVLTFRRVHARALGRHLRKEPLGEKLFLRSHGWHPAHVSLDASRQGVLALCP